MKKWEYKRLTFAQFREAYPDLAIDSLDKWLSTFGADGWELTFVVATPHPEWYLRREILQPLTMTPIAPC